VIFTFPPRIGEIVHRRRRISADTVLRLARHFKTNPEFWLNCKISANSNSLVAPARFQKSNATFILPPSWLVSGVLFLFLL
jgi:plasmid maintenance system antidote protein VapI